MPYKDPEKQKRCARECSARHEAKRRAPGPGLGYFKDNTDRMRKAIEYLSR